ncbi:hypothetical protein LshimejAT787_0101740 [Lyophyllum shimeji]|uniref:Uncharacterized protein n=1 Tax=Lyophyllum shimeji TaxID=47721 RepID=A0A9P3PC86_LYOSH|nr:hypothetical protein LshimejAT787_0101740 [Lyophyllum shimeji]
MIVLTRRRLSGPAADVEQQKGAPVLSTATTPAPTPEEPSIGWESDTATSVKYPPKMVLPAKAARSSRCKRGLRLEERHTQPRKQSFTALPASYQVFHNSTAVIFIPALNVMGSTEVCIRRLRAFYAQHAISWAVCQDGVPMYLSIHSIVEYFPPIFALSIPWWSPGGITSA